MSRRIVKLGVLAIVGLALLIQAVPYGRDHSNPAVTAEAPWTSARTRELAMNACGDCHSNLTRWPWYTSVAPVSWLTERDVKEGRRALNFSEWNRAQEGRGEAIEQVRSGEMPPLQYKLLHPQARLSDSERRQLISGLQATLGR